MAKKKSMQKEVEKTEENEEKTGEQLDLIDVAPENAKPLIDEARVYKKHQRARLAAEKKEVEHKQKLLSLVREANLQRLPDGVIKFVYNGVTVKITPRDDLVQVTEKEE